MFDFKTLIPNFGSCRTSRQGGLDGTWIGGAARFISKLSGTCRASRQGTKKAAINLSFDRKGTKGDTGETKETPKKGNC